MLITPSPKKGNLKQGQNYHTISLISHPNKIMHSVILNQLKSLAKELLAEEQAGLDQARAQWSRSSTLESFWRNTYNISTIYSTMS